MIEKHVGDLTMYREITIVDTVRIPPNRFGEDQRKVIKEILQENYEGILDKDLGVIIAITGISNVDVGQIIPGDGASYHKTEFSALVYLPVVGELVEAEVVEIVDFGAFVRLGPMDGLVHISQVTDDYIVRDRKQGILVGKETKRILREGDKVRARVVTVSMKGSGTSKIGLSMRQPGLGKFEWIEEEKKGEEGSKG